MTRIALALVIAVTLRPLQVTSPERESADSDATFEAIAERFVAIVLRQPRRGTALDMLVRHYVDAGRLDDLVARMERLAESAPDNAARHLALGLLYKRRGRDADALRALARASELDPNDAYADYYRGLLLADQCADDAAIAAFRAAPARKPARSELLC
jgi:tetratricopeptide (TPR) repeat protein